MAFQTITGTDFADVLVGGDQDDLIEGLAGNDLLLGGKGDDEIQGGEGEDILVGEDGDDFLEGNTGNDVMLGGKGNDVMDWDNGDGSDIMEGGEGYDIAEIDGADTAGDHFVINADGERVDFQRVNLGLFSLDIGSTEKMELNGQGGDDTMDARGLTAGLIKLVAEGGAGNDLIWGSQGDDKLYGGGDHDTLIGGRGNDLMAGGAGRDTMVWNNGDGSDVMDGGKGYDTAVVNGADTAGDAFTVASNGSDVLFQRTNLGPFAIEIENTEKLAVNGQGGDDTVDAGALNAGQIKLVINGDAGNDVLLGSQGDDLIYGGADDDLLIGNRGNDLMAGGAGRDTMVWNNGDGSDVMDGGKGYDTAVVNGADTAGDVFTVGLSGGHVLFERTNLGPFSIEIENTEKLVVNGQGGDDSIDASGLPEGYLRLVLDGGAGNDTITGSAGDDRIAGGSGDDWLTGGWGDDTFVFSAGRDTVTDFEAGEDQVLVEGLTTFASGQEIVDAAVQQGADVVIDFGNGNVLTLADTWAGDLQAGDFGLL